MEHLDYAVHHEVEVKVAVVGEAFLCGDLRFAVRCYMDIYVNVPGNACNKSSIFLVISNFPSSLKTSGFIVGTIPSGFNALPQHRDSRFPNVSASSAFKIRITLVSL